MFRKALVGALILSLALWGAAGLAPPAVQASEVIKIGIIDLQRALTESKRGQEAKRRLIKKFEQRQKELDLRQAEIEKAKQELERQAEMLSPEAKYEKEKALQRRIRDFKDLYQDYTERMKKEEYEATQPMVEGILQLAHDLGKERGYSLIIESGKSGIIYYPKSLDITDEVIKRFDASR